MYELLKLHLAEITTKLHTLRYRNDELPWINEFLSISGHAMCYVT